MGWFRTTANIAAVVALAYSVYAYKAQNNLQPKLSHNPDTTYATQVEEIAQDTSHISFSQPFSDEQKEQIANVSNRLYHLNAKLTEEQQKKADLLPAMNDIDRLLSFSMVTRITGENELHESIVNHLHNSAHSLRGKQYYVDSTLSDTYSTRWKWALGAGIMFGIGARYGAKKEKYDVWPRPAKNFYPK